LLQLHLGPLRAVGTS